MKVAIIGTVGVPANYGGFETLVEQLVRHNKSEDLEYAVYCSGKSYKEHHWVYHGAKTEYIGLHANGFQSIPYDIISLIRASKKSDVILILGVSGCIFLPIFRLFSKKKLIINIDGLEHKRDKWNRLIRRFLKFSERMAIKHGDIIITDNQGITDYVRDEYGVDSKLIAYGGDHVIHEMDYKASKSILDKYDLIPNEYSLALCRIEPENNVHTILKAFRDLPSKKLVFIGNWDRSEYGQTLYNEFSKYQNINLITAIYDLTTLNAIRSNCLNYIHGHSAGGTNPSLVEAMFFSKPIIAFDCIYNRETTENKALYFSDSPNLMELLEDSSPCETISQNMRDIAIRRYKWNHIVQQYEHLFCSDDNTHRKVSS